MAEAETLPSPARIVLLALHMRATELGKSCNTPPSPFPCRLYASVMTASRRILLSAATAFIEQGTPVDFNFAPLHNLTLLHGLVSPHPKFTNQIATEYLRTNNASKSTTLFKILLQIQS